MCLQTHASSISRNRYRAIVLTGGGVLARRPLIVSLGAGVVALRGRGCWAGLLGAAARAAGGLLLKASWATRKPPLDCSVCRTTSRGGVLNVRQTIRKA